MLMLILIALAVYLYFQKDKFTSVIEPYTDMLKYITDNVPFLKEEPFAPFGEEHHQEQFEYVAEEIPEDAVYGFQEQESFADFAPQQEEEFLGNLYNGEEDQFYGDYLE